MDDLLLARGLAEDRRTACGLIMSGKVLVADVVCTKAGSSFRSDVAVRVRGRQLSYASRGGYKLAAALEAFDCEVLGRVVLDAGASTGGFTDCLLQHGALHVYAVDVGFGQLRGRLAADPRVTNLERTNIGSLQREQFVPPIAVAVADLSNLTLVKAIPILAALFEGPVEIVALIKPLFEGLDRESMDDPSVLGETLGSLVRRLGELGYGWRDVIASPVRGGRDSVEFLAHVARGTFDVDARIQSAVRSIPRLDSAQGSYTE